MNCQGSLVLRALWYQLSNCSVVQWEITEQLSNSHFVGTDKNFHVLARTTVIRSHSSSVNFPTWCNDRSRRTIKWCEEESIWRKTFLRKYIPKFVLLTCLLTFINTIYDFWIRKRQGRQWSSPSFWYLRHWSQTKSKSRRHQNYSGSD